MSIIWKVSAQVALQAANSCCLLKKKEVGNHREHLVAGVNTRKQTGNDKSCQRTALANARGWQIKAHLYLKMFMVCSIFLVHIL